MTKHFVDISYFAWDVNGTIFQQYYTHMQLPLYVFYNYKAARLVVMHFPFGTAV